MRHQEKNDRGGFNEKTVLWNAFHETFIKDGGRRSWVVWGNAVERENKEKTKKIPGSPTAWSNLKKTFIKGLMYIVQIVRKLSKEYLEVADESLKGPILGSVTQ